jgi:hypothetical protein
MADALDLKSNGGKPPCGFDSRLGYFFRDFLEGAMAVTRLEIFEEALASTKCLREKHPCDAAIQSIIKQLEYLVQLADGKESDATRLKDIIITILAVREIEPLDMSVANQLYRVVEEVESMQRSGLHRA